MANTQQYSDTAINEFLALAQEVGITRAKRELGYPKSWVTGRRWAELRGITIATDEIMAKAKASDEWYKTEEVITIAQEGMNRVYDELVNNTSLTSDDQKKLSEAFMKHYNVWANAQGKATNINESRVTDGVDAELMRMIDEEVAKNSLKREATVGSR